MNNASNIQTNADSNTCTIVTTDGNKLVLRPDVEPRMVAAIDGKIQTVDEQGAIEMARELNAWGVTEARALGCAVVLWG